VLKEGGEGRPPDQGGGKSRASKRRGKGKAQARGKFLGSLLGSVKRRPRPRRRKKTFLCGEIRSSLLQRGGKEYYFLSFREGRW